MRVLKSDKSAITAAGLLLLGTLQFLQGIDWVVSKFENPGRIMDVISFFIQPPTWFSGLLYVGGLLFAWYAIRVARSQPVIEQGNLESWFERDYLELYELAYLSLGKRPQPGKQMPEDVLHRHRLLRDAVNDGKLPAKSMNANGKPNLMTRVHLKDFAKFAKEKSHSDFILLAERWNKYHVKREISEVDAENEELTRGYNRARSRLVVTKDDTLTHLAQLRTEGVVIRNSAFYLKSTNDLDEWVGKVTEWMNDVISALKSISNADAEWFATLDRVPEPRVSIPDVRFERNGDRGILYFTFCQHDFRLVRLEDLLKKYGVGPER